MQFIPNYSWFIIDDILAAISRKLAAQDAVAVIYRSAAIT